MALVLLQKLFDYSKSKNFPESQNSCEATQQLKKNFEKNYLEFYNNIRTINDYLKLGLCKQTQEKVLITQLMGVDQDELVQIHEIFQNLDSLYTFQLKDCFYFKGKGFLIFNYFEGEELFEQIIENQFFSENRAKIIMKAVLKCIQYIHQNNLMIRDLKPENILIQRNDLSQLKITAFNTMIKCHPEQRLNQKIGTPYYIAPEVINQNYSQKADIWSAGIILFILLLGFPLFNGPSDSEILGKIKAANTDTSILKVLGQYPEFERLSFDAKDLIKHMICIERNRFSAYEALQHNWFQETK